MAQLCKIKVTLQGHENLRWDLALLQTAVLIYICLFGICHVFILHCLLILLSFLFMSKLLAMQLNELICKYIQNIYIN